MSCFVSVPMFVPLHVLKFVSSVVASVEVVCALDADVAVLTDQRHDKLRRGDVLPQRGDQVHDRHGVRLHRRQIRPHAGVLQIPLAVVHDEELERHGARLRRQPPPSARASETTHHILRVPRDGDRGDLGDVPRGIPIPRREVAVADRVAVGIDESHRRQRRLRAAAVDHERGLPVLLSEDDDFRAQPVRARVDRVRDVVPFHVQMRGLDRQRVRAREHFASQAVARRKRDHGLPPRRGVLVRHLAVVVAVIRPRVRARHRRRPVRVKRRRAVALVEQVVVPTKEELHARAERVERERHRRGVPLVFRAETDDVRGG